MCLRATDNLAGLPSVAWMNADARLATLFSFYDTDGDGKLTKKEKFLIDSRLAEIMQNVPGLSFSTGAFSDLDADGSGDVDQDEFIEGVKKQYRHLTPDQLTRLLDGVTDLANADTLTRRSSTRSSSRWSDDPFDGMESPPEGSSATSKPALAAIGITVAAIATILGDLF